MNKSKRKKKVEWWRIANHANQTENKNLPNIDLSNLLYLSISVFSFCSENMQRMNQRIASARIENRISLMDQHYWYR